MTDDIDRAMEARRGTPFLDTAQAAHYLGLARQTLEKMRRIGGGPRYRKHGRYVRYHVDDLIAWSTACSRIRVAELPTQMRSASERDRHRLG